MACNYTGVLSERQLTITITPPWWKTWWAYASYILAFLIALWSFIKWRVSALKKEKVILEEKVAIRTLELSEEKEKVESTLTELKATQAQLIQFEKMNDRLRISRELHDDIGSTLGSISIYSEVAKSRAEKNESSDEALSKIGITSRDLIDKMSDIVWSLNPNNESFEQLQIRMSAFAAMILAPRNILFEFEIDEQLKALQLTSEQRKNIFLIFKEAVYNITKYADCKKVIITLNMRDNVFRMMIKDDGKGFDVALQNTEVKNESLGGNGIKNMQARAADIHALLNIHSEINKGTTIELNLKV